MAKRHRVVIIGIGGIAHMHAAAVNDLADRATLLAGSCRNEEKGRQFAEKWRCNWYEQFEKMLDAEKPDVAMICTPSGFHLEPTLACAKRGIHVLCEKPIEISTQRVDQMIEAADKHHIVLGGIFPSRFNDSLSLMRKAVGEGRFGRIAVAGTYVPWWRDDAYYAPTRWQGKLKYDGGGALMNQSIHGIDALQWIVSACPCFNPGLKPHENPVAEVFALTGKLGHAQDLIEVEDTAVACLRFRNGTLGQILGATSMFPGRQRRTVIAGRDGTAEVEEHRLVAFNFRNARPEDKAELDKHAATDDVTHTGASNPLAISHEGHTANLRSFLDALDAGKSPAIDGIQARKAVAIIEAIYESARTGKLARPV